MIICVRVPGVGWSYRPAFPDLLHPQASQRKCESFSIIIEGAGIIGTEIEGPRSTVARLGICPVIGRYAAGGEGSVDIVQVSGTVHF